MKQIKEFLEYINPYYFDGGIDEVINRLEELKKENNEYCLSFSYNKKDNGDIELWGSRKETEEERKERIREERKQREARKIEKMKQEEEERELLARLKAKYE